LYWDARFLMNWMSSNGRPLEEKKKQISLAYVFLKMLSSINGNFLYINV
jgi:hypothetical protein